MRNIPAFLETAGFEPVETSEDTHPDGTVLVTVWPGERKFRFTPPGDIESCVVEKVVQARTTMMLVLYDDQAFFKHKGIPQSVRITLRDELKIPFIQHEPLSPLHRS